MRYLKETEQWMFPSCTFDAVDCPFSSSAGIEATEVSIIKGRCQKMYVLQLIEIYVCSIIMQISNHLKNDGHPLLELYDRGYL